jgi:tetratricopeptide (TPR) repeat protein
VAAAPVLFAMAAGVVEHSQHFANTQALWEHELRVHPADTVPLLSLADLRIQQRRWDEGLALVQRLDRAAARDRNAAARLSAALLGARAIGQSAPHGDRGALQALAAFYDDLLAGRRAQLHGRGTRIALTLPPAQLSRVRDDVRDVVVPRAFVYARVGRHPDAIAVLEAARERARNDLDVYRALALVNAQAGRFAPARESLRAAAELAPTDPSVDSLRARVDQAERLFARADPRPAVRAATDAQAYLLLNATDMAAAALEHGLAQTHDEPQLRAMLAQVDAIEGQFHAARGRIESARLQHPEAEPLWQATLRDIAQLEAKRAAP